MNKKGRFLRALLPVAFLSLLSLCVFLPLALLLTGSITHSRELNRLLAPMLGTASGFVGWSFLPKYPTLRHYVDLLLDRPQFFVMLWNSVAIVGGSLLGQLLLSVPAAWWFARNKRRFGKRLFVVYIVLMLMPFQVTMVSNYLMLNTLGLLDSLWSIWLPAAFSPFPVFILYRFLHDIPDSVIEASEIDGANQWQVFTNMAIPMGSAGIASAMVLTFIEYWNLIEQPLTFLKTKALWPLSLYLPEIGMELAGVAMAAAIVTLLPSLLVFLYGQSYLEQGIVATGLK